MRLFFFIAEATTGQEFFASPHRNPQAAGLSPEVITTISGEIASLNNSTGSTASR